MLCRFITTLLVLYAWQRKHPSYMYVHVLVCHPIILANFIISSYNINRIYEQKMARKKQPSHVSNRYVGQIDVLILTFGKEINQLSIYELQTFCGYISILFLSISIKNTDKSRGNYNVTIFFSFYRTKHPSNIPK